MTRTLVTYLLAGTALLGAGGAAAQSTQTDQPDPAYTIDTPTADIDPSEAPLLEGPATGNEVQEVLSRFSAAPERFTQTEGRALYETTCQGCHMEDGKGAEGAGHYPPLAGNAKLVSKYYILSVLLTGYHGMPRFGDQMDDAQLAALANYVRNSFGNEFPGEIVPEDVAGMRAIGR
jgi:mono/diheme cytochrome c family protein